MNFQRGLKPRTVFNLFAVPSSSIIISREFIGVHFMLLNNSGLYNSDKTLPIVICSLKVLNAASNVFAGFWICWNFKLGLSVVQDAFREINSELICLTAVKSSMKFRCNLYFSSEPISLVAVKVEWNFDVIYISIQFIFQPMYF